MDCQDFKAKYYLFDPNKFGNIFVFVDFGNVRPWAKEFWPEDNKNKYFIEIDISKVYEVCSWINPQRKFFYYGYFPNNHKSFRGSIYRIDKARKSGFLVRTKEIKFIPHYDDNGKYIGKIPKCNFDVEITMDMITKMNKYDSIMLLSGDSDFGGLLGYLKNNGKKIIVICTRNRMSSELESVADKFIPAETLKNFLKLERKQNTPPRRAEV